MEDYKEYAPQEENTRIKFIKNTLMIIGTIIVAPFFLTYYLIGHRFDRKK